MAQVYDYYLNRKEIAILYYEKYLGANTANIQPNNSNDTDLDRLKEIVQSRINYLKESLNMKE